MNPRFATRPAASPRRLVACGNILLCAAIAVALFPGPARAAAASAVDAAASGVDASGADAQFDRSLLSGAGDNTTDLSRFEHGNPVLPGTYNTDLYLNGAWVGRTEVRFDAAGEASATPCVDRKLLDQLGLRPEKVPAPVMLRLQDPKACVGIGSIIPGATMSFDMPDLRLDTSVPQAFLGEMPRGYVSPQYWDAGVPAALLNYNFNTYQTSSLGQRQTSSYLGLNAGFNLGQWHFRHDSSYDWQSAANGAPASRQWRNIDSYVRRDLPSLRSQLTVGDAYTDGQVFDSFSLRGVQLATDDRMLPDSLRGYAPVVRGVANTNAVVTIRQNGVQIYQTTVAPGPFTINDLYPTGYGGSLDVTVTEADGRKRTFSVPYASVAQLLRPGITRFDIAAGTLRNFSLVHTPAVAQATMQHGFSNLLTGYTGVQAAPGYAALLLGSAVNTAIGAFALDVTEAHTRIPGFASHAGQSMRISFSKLLPQTQTSLSVAAYRYSTAGFLSLTDAALARDYARRGLDPFTYVLPPAASSVNGVPVRTLLTPAQQAALSGNFYSPAIDGIALQRQRSRFDLTLSQRLGQSGGSFYANASLRNYWNRAGTDTQFQVGYNNSFHGVSYGISATRTRNPLGRYENEYFANISVPFGDGPHAPSLSLNLTNSGTGGSQEQAMLNGSAGVDNQFNYGVTASHGSGSIGNAGSINGGYRSPYAVFNAGYGVGSGYSQASLGISGAVVAHPGGVTFGQPMGETAAIVYVPHGRGAYLNNAAGARIDRFGYALVPYLTPYSLNTVQIDPKGLSLDVQLDATSTQVAPYAGALVMLKFKTQNGRTIILRARLTNGKTLPFGAEVFNEKGVSMGLVGQNGEILARGVNESGKLTAQWHDENGAAQSCSLGYQLKPKSRQKEAVKQYEVISTVCTQPAANTLVSRSGT